jgi:hypothetical protein
MVGYVPQRLVMDGQGIVSQPQITFFFLKQKKKKKKKK